MKKIILALALGAFCACGDSSSDTVPAGSDAGTGADTAGGGQDSATESGAAASCATFTYSCNVAGANQCADVASKADPAQNEMLCKQAGGAYSTTDKCPAMGKGGGCVVQGPDAGLTKGADCKTQWFYAATSDGAKLYCTGQKGTFVSP